MIHGARSVSVGGHPFVLSTPHGPKPYHSACIQVRICEPSPAQDDGTSVPSDQHPKKRAFGHLLGHLYGCAGVLWKLG
jgi:hypothetical protein